MPRIDLLAIRSGQASDWTATNPQLGDGEPAFENDTGLMKVGNGTTLWNDLPYTAAEGPEGDIGPPGPPGGPSVVAVPFGQWPPQSPTADVLYLRLAP